MKGRPVWFESRAPSAKNMGSCYSDILSSAMENLVLGTSCLSVKFRRRPTQQPNTRFNMLEYTISKVNLESVISILKECEDRALDETCYDEDHTDELERNINRLCALLKSKTEAPK